jgi:hypothetical protein
VFTVTPPPAGVGVTAVEPRCTYAGCVVIVRGWGFSASIRQNRVTFNGRPVRVARATPVELELNLPQVPPATAPLMIDVRRIGQASTAPFTLTAAPGATPTTTAVPPAAGATRTTTTTTVRTTTTGAAPAARPTPSVTVVPAAPAAPATPAPARATVRVRASGSVGATTTPR